MKDIKVESMVPENCKKAATVDEFFKELEKADSSFEKQLDEATKQGKKLRYMASIENGKATAYCKDCYPSHAGSPGSECYRFSLSLPVSTQVVGMTSLAQLEQNVRIARNFKPMPAAEKEALLARVKDQAGDGRHELFKSTKFFDGPHHRKQHDFDLQTGD